jgi:hypothetical protein
LSNRSRIATNLWTHAGLFVLGVWVVTALFPHAGFASLPEATRSIFQRVFPGVPSWWMALRLALLGIGAWLLSLARSMPDGDASPSVAHDAIREPSPRRVWLSIAAGVFAIACALGREQLSRAGQMAFLVSLLAPAALLLTRRPASAVTSDGRRRLHRIEWLVIALWLAWRVPLSLHATRAADLIDTWLGFQYVQETIAMPRNLLVEGFLPGMSGLYLILQGAQAFGPDGIPLSFVALQLVCFAWLVATAVGVASLARLWIGGAGALLALCVFLSAPLTLMMPLGPTPYFLGPGVGIAMLLLAEAVVRRKSSAALVALAPLLGLSPAIPLVLPAAAFAAVRVGWAFATGTRFPRAIFVAAVLPFLAAAWVAVPRPAAVGAMVGAYVEKHGEWEGLERALFGQTSPVDVARAWEKPLPGALDVPLAGLVAPFAVARTPMRGWGDSIFDPLGTALIAVGVALCLRSLLRSARSRWLLLMLGLTLLPGMTSSFDRPSITRMSTLLLPASLLAALGGRRLAELALPALRARTIAVLATGVVIGGALLFDVVNPRILAASWLSLAIDAANDRPDGRTLVLDHPATLDVSWLHTARIASEVPTPPIEALSIDRIADLTTALDAVSAATHVVFWSPALERDLAIATALCERWPRAELFRIEDRPRHSHVFAARIGRGAWEPALSADRWVATSCEAARKAAPQRAHQ